LKNVLVVNIFKNNYLKGKNITVLRKLSTIMWNCITNAKCKRSGTKEEEEVANTRILV